MIVNNQPSTVLVVTPTNGSATAGMVLGILSIIISVISPFTGFLCCLISLPMAFFGAIFSLIGYSNSKQNGVGNASAVTGLILNFLQITGVIVGLVGIVILGFSV
tara:strand:+ start:4487 stop:4801 length:315 start_codon:yes stop_codon:yes gene_type:complete